MKFTPEIVPQHDPSTQVLAFLIEGNNVLIDNKSRSIPTLEVSDLRLKDAIYLGRYNQTPCYVSEISQETVNSPHSLLEIRSLYGVLHEELYSIIGYASQILTWSKNHQFCSKCGSKTTPSQTERAAICTCCNFMNYPRISPSIIVAITRGNELLLARNVRFKEGLYSLIAGFVEPGESLEQCVEREVREEVGIEVKNIKYVISQPWAFPHSLMVGFTAEYASGDLNIDPTEIESARWVTANSLPLIPSQSTIARWLIDDYLKAFTGN